METKRCPRCQTALAVSEFHKNRRNPDGFTAYCKTCVVELAAEQRARAIAARKPTDTKSCRKCETTKTVLEFHKDGRSRDGLCSYCKECNKARTRAWSLANPEKTKAQGRKRTESGLQRPYRLRRKYGLSVADYDAMLEGQGGVCAICGTTKPGRTDRFFHVDHCHASNRVRGLLCSTCNRALGLFGDSAKTLAGAIAYLQEESYQPKP